MDPDRFRTTLGSELERLLTLIPTNGRVPESLQRELNVLLEGLTLELLHHVSASLMGFSTNPAVRKLARVREYLRHRRARANLRTSLEHALALLGHRGGEE